MKQRLTRLPTQVLAAVTMTWLLATALVAVRRQPGRA